MPGGEVMYSTGWKFLNTLALDSRTRNTGWGVLYSMQYSLRYGLGNTKYSIANGLLD